MSDTAEILDQAARWRGDGKGVALATVVKTWGSSPRPPGAKLVGQRRAASSSARSRAAASRARSSARRRRSIQDGKPRLLDFGISDDQAWEVGLACGGKVAIFVERVE